FVDAQSHCLDHAPALGVRAQHDDRDIRHRKHAWGAHDAHEFGAVEQRQLPIEDHHVGPDGADRIEPGDAVARFVNLAHADVDEQIAHDLAHELVVVDHKHSKVVNHT